MVRKPFSIAVLIAVAGCDLAPHDIRPAAAVPERWPAGPAYRSSGRIEYTVQTSFREVADALARRGTIDRQRADQQDLIAAAARSYSLADSQYRAGTDTFLNALIAQRTLYSARQTQLAVIE